MKFKYYSISFLLSLILFILAIIFYIPYALKFDEENKTFEKATVSIVSPPRGERKIKLIINNKEQYWLSCYGIEHLCKGDNIGKTININNVKVFLN